MGFTAADFVDAAFDQRSHQARKVTMQFGLIGLGRMGGNIARRAMRGGHACVAYDRDHDAIGKLVADGATGAEGIDDLVGKLAAPRVIWIMLPAGRATEGAVTDLAERLNAGDTVIDGGNTFYKDDIRRAKTLEAAGLHYVDVGTSGGVWGLERGYCMMVGGERAIVETIDPLLRTLAPGAGSIARTSRPESADPRAVDGYIHAGPPGAGHFVKMVHNGIEYGLMQAYAEGFDILRSKSSEALPEGERFDLNLPDIAEVLASRQRDLIMAARPCRPGACERRGAWRLHRRSRRQRGRPLDCRGRDRAGGARGGAHCGAVREISLSPGTYVRREAAVRHAAWLRRSYRTALKADINCRMSTPRLRRPRWRRGPT